jgi:hypothetical protein
VAAYQRGRHPGAMTVANKVAIVTAGGFFFNAQGVTLRVD